MNKLTKVEKSWILYDCANSAYSLAITTAILPIYFKGVVAAGLDNSLSTAYWGYANTIATMVVALSAPILGTIADYKGFKKKFFNVFLFLGIIATALLGFFGKGDILPCLIIYSLSVLGFSGANIFYDAFLVDVTDENTYDKVSSYGFAFGYISSIIPFIISFVIISNPTIIGLNGESGTIIATQLSFVITAIWWLVLSFPLIKNVSQKHYVEREPKPIFNSFKRLIKTFKEIKKYKKAALFLLAYFFYIDGVHTIIKMATAYGKDIGIKDNTLLLILLVIQVVAFPCAILYNFLATKISAKFMIMFGISLYTGITIFAFFMNSEIHFWIVGILVGTAQGGIQALSRSTYSKLIPKENSSEFFGLYNILGKFSAAIGPFLVASISHTTGNPRLGVLSLVVLFITGGILLYKLDINKDNTVKDEMAM